MNAQRQPYGTINVSRPLSAYSVPIPVVDPGPDGRPGSADDGTTLTAYDLTPEALAAAPVNLTTNLPDSDSDYYTWEITATKRPSETVVAAGELHQDVEVARPPSGQETTSPRTR